MMYHLIFDRSRMSAEDFDDILVKLIEFGMERWPADIESWSGEITKEQREELEAAMRDAMSEWRLATW